MDELDLCRHLMVCLSFNPVLWIIQIIMNLLRMYVHVQYILNSMYPEHERVPVRFSNSTIYS